MFYLGNFVAFLRDSVGFFSEVVGPATWNIKSSKRIVSRKFFGEKNSEIFGTTMKKWLVILGLSPKCRVWYCRFFSPKMSQNDAVLKGTTSCETRYPPLCNCWCRRPEEKSWVMDLMVKCKYVFADPYMGASKNRGTQNGWFIVENPMNKSMIWGYHYVWKHPYVYTGSSKTISWMVFCKDCCLIYDFGKGSKNQQFLRRLKSSFYGLYLPVASTCSMFIYTAWRKNAFTWQFCWCPFWDGENVTLLEWFFVTSNDRGWKGHELNHLVQIISDLEKNAHTIHYTYSSMFRHSAG